MAETKGHLVIERILRDREGIWQQIIHQRKLKQLTGQMLASSAIALAAYGAVLGFYNSPLQAGMSLLKLPILFLATLVICLPTLYLFNLVFGAKLSIAQAVALVMTAVTVISTLALAFAPISLFFLITAPNYTFFKLLNVAILMLAAFVGLTFLTSGMSALNEHRQRESSMNTPADVHLAMATQVDKPISVTVATPIPADADASTQPAPGQVLALPRPNGANLGSHPHIRPTPLHVPSSVKPASMGLLYIWILLFGFVGTQLGWTLRPFFGEPNTKFELFRHIEGNFYIDIARSIGHLF